MENINTKDNSEKTNRQEFWSGILVFVALLLAFLFYEVFPMWLEIQEAGGWDAWINDSEAQFAHLLLFLTRLAM